MTVRAEPKLVLVAHMGALGNVYRVETARQSVQVRVTPSGLIRVGAPKKWSKKR